MGGNCTYVNQTPEEAFALIVAAALAGERCPMNANNGGPLEPSAISLLIRAGWIRSEISGRNFRRVVILTGPHAGKATGRDPTGSAVWKVVERQVRAGTVRSGATTRVFPNRWRAA